MSKEQKSIRVTMPRRILEALYNMELWVFFAKSNISDEWREAMAFIEDLVEKARKKGILI